MAAGLASAGVSVAAQRTLDRTAVPVAGWTRANYAGRPVTLAGGVAAATVSVAAAVAFAPRRRGLRYGVATSAAALAGMYDDLVAPRWEGPDDKGGRGHLQALRHGRPSGGVVKVLVIGAGALVGSGAGGRGAAAVGSSGASMLRRGTDAVLVAGAANLVNLFDLRPGRAAKVALIAAVPMLAGPAALTAGSAAGVAAAALPGDLGERHLLGDTGANPLGALLGLALTGHGRRTRAAALGVVLALTAASERVSFSRVIADTAPLRALDEWGRRR